MKNVFKIISVTAFALSLAACGHSPGERAVSGAGLGAAGGAVGGALVGNPAAGALVGAAVGGAAGGLTSDKDINLGKPIWK